MTVSFPISAGGVKRLSGIALLAALAMNALTGCRAQQPWPLWEAYTQRFIDGQGRVIDRSARDRTTSEGQAYAMFFALVDDDKARFDKLLDWTQTNLAGGDLTERLPAWEWGRTDAGDWKVLDGNPASDADLWLAYTLLEAGRLWHDPRYETLGRTLATRVANEEVVLVDGVGTTLAPGPHGFHPDDQSWILNPSYMPLPVLTRLAREQPQGPWSGVAESLAQVLNGQATHGFAMDWVSAGKEGAGVHPEAAPREATSGVHEPQAAGSYDAIRVYLWLGIADKDTPGERELLGQVAGMATYLKGAVVPPEEVTPDGSIVRPNGPPGFSAAVVPYLAAMGLKAQAKMQQDRLTATRDPASGLYGRTTEYYDQNLALFSTGYLEQRYRFERDGKLKVKWK